MPQVRINIWNVENITIPNNKTEVANNLITTKKDGNKTVFSISVNVYFFVTIRTYGKFFITIRIRFSIFMIYISGLALVTI